MIDAAAQPRRRPFYGWAVVAACMAVTFATGPGQTQVVGIFVGPIIDDLGLSRVLISTLYTIGNVASALAVLAVGRLADRHGPRRLLIAVALAFGAACLGLGWVGGPVGLAVGFAVLRALGPGALSILAALLVAQWFVRVRGRAMAVAWLGLSLANAVLPPLAHALIGTVGWRGAYALLGAMIWALVLPAAILVVRDRPEDRGLHPDGAAERPALEDVARAGDGRRVLVTPRFWALALPVATPAFVSTALLFHQGAIFAQRGLSADVAAAVFPAFAAAAAVANQVAGYVADRWSPKWALILDLGVFVGAMLVAQLVASPLGAIGYACLLGAGSGMQSVVAGVTWAHYYGRRRLGAVQGPGAMVVAGGAAVGPLPLAALAAAMGGFGPSLAVLAVVPVAAIVAAVVLWPGGRAD